LARRADVVPSRAGVVIVGGGMAGLELAKHLDLAGTTDVVVIESGPDGDRRHVNAVNDPTAALGLWLGSEAAAELWRPWESATPPFYARRGGLRRRLGGRSLYWHGVVLPIEPWALSPQWWPEQVVEDLTGSWRGGPGLHERVTADLSAWRGRQSTPGQPLRVGDFRLTPTPKAVRPVGDGWEAYSPLSFWRDPGSGDVPDGATTFLTGAHVLGVLIADGRAVGVRVRHTADDSEATLRCPAVVLAAGTIENSRLAIQARHDAGVATEPVLSGLVDHIEQGILVVSETDRLPAELAALALADSHHHVAGDARSRTHLFTRFYPLPDSDGDSVVLEVFATGEQERGEHGSVRCETGTGWPWKTTVHAELSRADREVIRAGRAILNRFWRDFSALVGVPARPVRFPDFDDPDRTVADVLLGLGRCRPGEPVGWSSLLGTVDHESGTLPLGQLLTDRHEFRRIPGLYAAGPATFPRCGAANPSLTTLALSRRLAGLLAETLR
jgi:choline dehydrogenase-like flavoprotein